MGWACVYATLVMSAQPGLAETIGRLPVEHVADIRKDFNQPTEVAIDPQGRVFVLDGANQQIKLFNAKWKYIRSIGRPGKGNGEFRNPVGMDVDSNGRLFVADTGNQRIQIFDNSGKYRRQIDLAKWKARPVEVKAWSGKGRIYVSDANNHQVLAFKTDGTFLSSWGRLGDQTGELRYPGMMAVDNNKHIFVVDILNGRIQIFDPSGKNPAQIGELGVLPGQLYRPKGVTTDGRTGVYVSDSYTGIIQVFDTTGRLRGILSTGAKGAYLRLTSPLGMAIDAQKRLYVVQSTLNKVSIFNLK